MPISNQTPACEANLPSAIFLRSQSYDPPEREADVVSEVGTL